MRVRHKSPRKFRLTRRADIRRVFARRMTVSDGTLVIHFAPNSLEFTRLTPSVGRRFGNAVLRNRSRRLIREAFRLERLGLRRPGLDVVCVPRARETATLDAYRRSLRRLLDRAGRRLAEAPRARPPDPTTTTG